MPHWNTSGGTLIYYETHGDIGAGPPLLLVPGLLGSLEGQWRPYISTLAASHPVIAMDLRGHGQSDDGPGGLMLEAMLGDVAGLLDHLRVDRLHLAGYSLGGYLGTLLGLRHPDRLLTLLMHGTKFYWTPEVVAATQKQLDPDAIAAKVPAYAAQLARDHGSDRWPGRVRAAAAFVGGMVAAQVDETAVASLDCPVIVSVGDRDELVPLDEAARLRSALPDAGLLVLPRVRHAFGTVRRNELIEVMQGFHRAPRAVTP